MNLYLVELFLRFLRMIFVTFITLFNLNLYYEKTVNLQNTIDNVDSYAINTKILPVVKETKNNKQNVKKVVNNKQVVKSQPTVVNKTKDNKVLTTEKPVTTPLATYKGRLTGYGPDCAGCSGKGNLACKTREKKVFSLVDDGIYYTDKEYGKVRILAAATAKFKCGTIIEIKKPGAQPFIGIVLDSGGDMRKAWGQGKVWMDLAYSSAASSGTDKLTGYNITFNVQRWGW